MAAAKKDQQPDDRPELEVETFDPTELPEVVAEPEADLVAFALAGARTFELDRATVEEPWTSLRLMVGGSEIALDEGERYLTADAREISILDRHPHVTRVEVPA